MKDKREPRLLEALLMLVIPFILTALKGFILFSIWGWFAIPLGAIAVPIGAFIGASSAYWIFTMSTQDLRELELGGLDEAWKLIRTSVACNLILWLFAYLAYVVF